jgi:hypothetical protein
MINRFGRERLEKGSSWEWVSSWYLVFLAGGISVLKGLKRTVT